MKCWQEYTNTWPCLFQCWNSKAVLHMICNNKGLKWFVISCTDVWNEILWINIERYYVSMATTVHPYNKSYFVYLTFWQNFSNIYGNKSRDNGTSSWDEMEVLTNFFFSTVTNIRLKRTIIKKKNYGWGLGSPTINHRLIIG